MTPQEPDRASTALCPESVDKWRSRPFRFVGNRESSMRVVSFYGETEHRAGKIGHASQTRRSPWHALQGCLALLHEWRRRSRERAELAQLDDRILRDIGVSR